MSAPAQSAGGATPGASPSPAVPSPAAEKKRTGFFASLRGGSKKPSKSESASGAAAAEAPAATSAGPAHTTPTQTAAPTPAASATVAPAPTPTPPVSIIVPVVPTSGSGPAASAGDDLLGSSPRSLGKEGDAALTLGGRPETGGADGASAPSSSKRIGHYKVDKHTGEVAYKKVRSSELQESIQLGIRIAVGTVVRRPQRDLLFTDFQEVESMNFPKEGSSCTPPHHYSSFKFWSYAPVAFRYFREAFDINTADFLLSLCDKPMRELSNPGASGSVFYLSHDDKFIIKTVQKGEHHFLLRFLQGYYMSLTQNKRTILPKFYGLFCYTNSIGRNIRFIVMNNILPSHLSYSRKYDLKGSSFGREASEKERAKRSPTFKDLDFVEQFPEGLLMEPDLYDNLAMTIRRDCLVLESFKIMDYSLLIGLHRPGKDEYAVTPRHSIDPGTPGVAAVLSSSGGARHGRGKVQVHGRFGYADFINGVYEEQATTHDARPLFKLIGGVPRGNGTMSGSNLYLFYKESVGAWYISPVLEGSNVMAFAKDPAVHPGDVVAVWMVLTSSGEHEDDTQLAVARVPVEEDVTPAAAEYDSDSSGRPGSFVFPDSISNASEDDSSHDFHSAADHLVARMPAKPDYGGGILCHTKDGERMYMFVGIIDILQHYEMKKKLEHGWKSLIHDGKTVSVVNPKFYARRFTDFMINRVLTKMPEPTSGVGAAAVGGASAGGGKGLPPVAGGGVLMRSSSTGSVGSAAAARRRRTSSQQEAKIKAEAATGKGGASPLLGGGRKSPALVTPESERRAARTPGSKPSLKSPAVGASGATGAAIGGAAGLTPGSHPLGTGAGSPLVVPSVVVDSPPRTLVLHLPDVTDGAAGVSTDDVVPAIAQTPTIPSTPSTPVTPAVLIEGTSAAPATETEETPEAAAPSDTSLATAAVASATASAQGNAAGTDSDASIDDDEMV